MLSTETDIYIQSFSIKDIINTAQSLNKNGKNEELAQKIKSIEETPLTYQDYILLLPIIDHLVPNQFIARSIKNFELSQVDSSLVIATIDMSNGNMS